MAIEISACSKQYLLNLLNSNRNQFLTFFIDWNSQCLILTVSHWYLDDLDNCHLCFVCNLIDKETKEKTNQERKNKLKDLVSNDKWQMTNQERKNKVKDLVSNDGEFMPKKNSCYDWLFFPAWNLFSYRYHLQAANRTSGDKVNRPFLSLSFFNRYFAMWL